MKLIRLVMLIFMVLFLISFGISVEWREKTIEAQAGTLVLSEAGIETVIRGAVENQSWMYSQSREEVSSSLSRYFIGDLLSDITNRCWDFIDEPTDWYSVARLEDVTILFNDDTRAVAEAIICIEDVDTGHNEVGKGLFTLVKTNVGWRISYASYSWNNKTG